MSALPEFSFTLWKFLFTLRKSTFVILAQILHVGGASQLFTLTA